MYNQISLIILSLQNHNLQIINKFFESAFFLKTMGFSRKKFYTPVLMIWIFIEVDLTDFLINPLEFSSFLHIDRSGNSRFSSYLLEFQRLSLYYLKFSINILNRGLQTGKGQRT